MTELIDRVSSRKALEHAVKRFRERGIVLPTFAQLREPHRAPARVIRALKRIGMQDAHPLNLFRITWHNEPVERGGQFGPVNYLALPPSLTGVKPTIVVLAGKWFPTGAHKVGAAYGCLAPKIVTGQFDPTHHKAVWPSTGNYCRGGAFDSALMGCTAVAILPEQMSKERFAWLRKIGAEVIATPGCESNVKEIYDECWRIRRTRPDCIIFNQFDEFGNACWHYHVTGAAAEEVYTAIKTPRSRFAAFVSATGSAGTIAAGDYLRTKFPRLKVVASEALQCPTLLMNGFGAHRIEGIGDKHVPWIHNVRNTDAVTAIDDEQCMRLFRLFNEREGLKFLGRHGVPASLIERLSWLGISSIANILSSIKAAKYFEWNEDDIIFTVATDSAGLYRSRIKEQREQRGAYTPMQAACDFDACLLAATTDAMKELSHLDRKAIHNLKYFTWVEQQGKEIGELNRLWNDHDFWPAMFRQPETWDELITEFNARTGVLRRV